MKASRLIGRGEYSAAGALYEKLAAAEPNDAFAVGMLALCYERQGRLTEALRLAEQAARQVPESLPALQAAARLAIANEEHERAEGYVERALALPEVRTGIPSNTVPAWLRWLLAATFRLPVLRRRVPKDALADLAPGKQAMDLEAWKQWALEYLAWRKGEDPASPPAGVVH